MKRRLGDSARRSQATPAQLQPVLDLVKAQLARHIGSLPVPVRLTTSPDRGAEAAETVGEYEGLRLVRCQINFTALGTRQKVVEIIETMAHEVFHCYQNVADGPARPAWIVEGGAEWVGSKVTEEIVQAPSSPPTDGGSPGSTTRMCPSG